MYEYSFVDPSVRMVATSQAPLTRGHCEGKHAASSPIANLPISGLNSEVALSYLN